MQKQADTAQSGADHPDMRGEATLDQLYRRPGFLLRRAHQISVSIFLQKTAGFGVTTTQFGALVVLRARGGLDQIGLARLVGIDRSTAALVVSKLEKARYIRRVADTKDRRRNVLMLTVRGRRLLDNIADAAAAAQDHALSVFTPREAVVFLDLLQRFVSSLNEDVRVPISDAAEPAVGARALDRQGRVG